MHGDVARDPSVICPDTRTSVVFRLEAFDLSEKGYDPSHFRRQMAILAKLLSRGPTPKDEIRGLFTKEGIEEIYPALGTVATRLLTDELELPDYVRTVQGLASITPKGAKKPEAFKESLPPEHRAVWAY